jgi:hypothetical protein
MKEDLRYLESLIEDIDYSSHPNDRTLSDFLNKKLKEEQRESILDHLAHCTKCSDKIVNIIPSKKKLLTANNISIKPIIITPLVALVASLVVFVNLPLSDDIERLGSEPSAGIYKGDEALDNRVLDADKILEELIKSTNLTHIESFNQAKEEENRDNFEKARGLYKLTLAKISIEEDFEKNLRYTIVIQNRLLQLSHKMKLEESVKNYKNILRHKIRIYHSKYNKKGDTR